MLTPDDLALLRRFEPIARFNKGEQFYPMDVERYLAGCALCVQRPNDAVEVLVPRGSLTVEELARPRADVPEAIYFLHFVDPLPPLQVAEFRRTSTLREFHTGRGRLARVGIIARLGDLVFSLSLLLRGKVPGGSAAAAAQRYHQLQADEERYAYYGRVIRDQGYTVLQYWFFYAFNDWRSSFNGVNDHEADWEMINIFLADEPSGGLKPCWLAYSSHEFEGDDLRRRWDDPGLTFVGEHPVVFVAAGAHANYFFAGEYLPTAEVPYTATITRIWRGLLHFWRTTLRQSSQPGATTETGLIRIPFVDYARGDGMTIGPGEARGWELHPLDATATVPAPPWIDGYRGLWGLYTGDVLSGEDAPARPKYNRNGSVFKLWYDPIGWSGLDKVPPPGLATLAALRSQQQTLEAEQQRLQEQIDQHVERLTGLEQEIEAIQQLPHLRIRTAEQHRVLRAAGTELARLKGQYAANNEVLAQFPAAAARLTRGDYGDPRAHLRLPQLPASIDDLHLGRLAEAWGALSIGLLLILTVALALFSRRWGIGLLAMLGVYAFIESLFKRQVRIFVQRVVVGLALLAALVLLFEFFWPVVAILVVLAGLLVIIENARELRSIE